MHAHVSERENVVKCAGKERAACAKIACLGVVEVTVLLHNLLQHFLQFRTQRCNHLVSHHLGVLGDVPAHLQLATGVKLEEAAIQI